MLRAVSIAFMLLKDRNFFDHGSHYEEADN